MREKHQANLFQRISCQNVWYELRNSENSRHFMRVSGFYNSLNVQQRGIF